MPISYKFFETSDDARYQEFIDNCEDALFYHSLKYKIFLEMILKKAQSRYLLAVEDDRIIGALPMFILQTELGAVVNSLPFFGSHGSVISLPNTQREVEKKLIQIYIEYCKSIQALSGTIISNLENPDEQLLNEIEPDYVTFRTGQVTTLPELGNDKDHEAIIMSNLHTKTRNMIRKGLKSGLVFQIDHDPQVLSDMFNLHYENIQVLDGIPKPIEMIEAVKICFERSEDYEIFTARTPSGMIVSGLLVFYFKDWVEYFVPVIKEQFRNMQPLSAIIYIAMRHSITCKSSRRWNWGGTWPSQTGVLFFKSRWGSREYPYKYFTREFSGISIKKNFKVNQLLESFRYFYLIPFSELDSVNEYRT